MARYLDTLSILLLFLSNVNLPIPLTKASEVELWCFLSSAPEQTVEQTIETLVIWDAIMLIMASP